MHSKRTRAASNGLSILLESGASSLCNICSSLCSTHCTGTLECVLTVSVWKLYVGQEATHSECFDIEPRCMLRIFTWWTPAERSRASFPLPRACRVAVTRMRPIRLEGRAMSALLQIGRLEIDHAIAYSTICWKVSGNQVVAKHNPCGEGSHACH